MKDIAVTIKPTMACNMHCKHCFNGEEMNNTTSLSLKTIFKLLDLASEEYENIKITFHGGEPTIMGYHYYASIFSFQQDLRSRRGTSFSNFFTTNGLLLDEKLIILLKDNNTTINISFDGPYNDVLRYHTDKVYQNILLAKKIGARVRIFCTLTSASKNHIVDIYKWFNERLIDFKIAPLEPWGYGANLSELLPVADEYVTDLMEAYCFWLKDKNCKIKVGTFEEFINLKSNQQFKPFWYGREIALNPNGVLYPFGRPNDIKYQLGIPERLKKLSDVFVSKKYEELLSFLNRTNYIRCSKCNSKNICNGVIENMTYMYVDEDKLVENRCKIADAVFKSALAIKESVLKDIIEGNSNIYNPIAIKYLKEGVNGE